MYVDINVDLLDLTTVTLKRTNHVQLDSPFQLQEHLKALYYHSTKSDKFNTTTAITRETALKLATPPENVDRPLWLYELCRFLVQRTNSLIVACFSDTPPCSSQTCPEMRASEWQYLCAVHDPPKSCCAIDYCCHTLDWAANILTSQKHFPSRLTLGSEAAGGSQQSVKQLTNIFRRVYRMFAHAWFEHRQVFWNVEGHEGLYIFFKTVCDAYNLIPEDNYTIPPEAEGVATEPRSPSLRDQKNPSIPTLLEKSSSNAPKSDTSSDTQDHSAEAATTISTGATTRRHKHTPSTGSSVTTILEGEEDDHHRREEVASTTSPATPEPMYQSEPTIAVSVVKKETHPLPVPPTKTETQDGQEGKRETVEPEVKEAALVSEGKREKAEEQEDKTEWDPVFHIKDEKPGGQTQAGQGEGEEEKATAESNVDSANQQIQHRGEVTENESKP